MSSTKNRNLIYSTILISILVACTKKSATTEENATETAAKADKETKIDEKNKDKTKETPAPTTTGTIAVSANNGLASTFPEGMQVTAFPKAVDTTPGTAAPGTLAVGGSGLWLLNNPPPNQENQQQFDYFAHHPKELLENAQNILSGKADSCFDESELRAINFQNHNNDICFGFDYGIISGIAEGTADSGQLNTIMNNNQSSSNATILSAFKTVNGYQADNSGEACMVTTGRKMIAETSSKLNGILALFRGLLCEAKKAKIDKFDNGSVDLTNIINKAPKGAITLKSAKIIELDKQNERSLYRTEVEFAIPNSQSQANTKVVLFHSPGKDSNETYNGVLNIYEPADQGGNHRYKSMSYEKSGSTYATQKLKIEVRDVMYTSQVTDTSPFDSKGNLDPNSGVTSSSGNEKLSSIGYFAFDVNPSSYAGKISFWTNPGGNYNEAARGFIYNSEQNDAGQLLGCSWAGAIRGDSIRKIFKEGGEFQPNGCFTPFLRNGTCGIVNDNQGDQVWKQCFKQTDAGIYIPDDSKNADDTLKFDKLDQAPNDMPIIDLSGINVFDNLE